MPVEEFPKCTVVKTHKLISKILETLNRFTKRINIHSFSLSELKHAKKISTNTDLTRSKSHDNLDFMRYVDDISVKKAIKQDYNHNNASRWEILSQINHTPQTSMKIGISDQSLADNKRLSRNKSMNDLLVLNNGTKSSKQVDKLNSLLDFVMGQMLDSPYRDSDKLLKSIQDLIVESGVQIILHSISELNESFTMKAPTWNPNYLRVVCSPGNSSSESETFLKPISLPIESNSNQQNNSLFTNIRENCQSNKIYSKNSSVVCIPNAHIDKGIKHRLNMRNITSPSFHESIAFKYSSKARKFTKKQSKIQYLVKDQRTMNGDRRVNGEYSCYVTAKKASNPPSSKTRSNLNGSVSNSKCSLENNHTSNLSPIPEDKNIESVNNLQNCNRVILSKSILEAQPVNHNPCKSRKTFQMPLPNKKLLKPENNERDKLVKKELNSIYQTPGRTQFTSKPLNEKLQIIKASSVECISSTHPDKIDKKNNVTVLSIKCNESKSMERDMKITPISFVFAGESLTNKSMITESYTLTDAIPVKKLKSVVSNTKYFQDDVKLCGLNPHVSEVTSVKSKTTFGIDSGYTSKGRQKLQIANYFIAKNHKNRESDDLTIKDQPQTIFVDMNSKKSKSLSNWSDYILKLESETNLHPNKDNCTSRNMTTIAMVNNNNDRADLEISENEQQNTDSSCTFHAVRAKYFKEYLPISCDSESTTNDNLLLNDVTRYVNLDPNPEEIRTIYEKVRGTNNVKQISIGRTYSCDENNDLAICNTSSVANSHSFITKYHTSSEDEDEPQNENIKSNNIVTKNQQINSLDWLNDNSIPVNHTPQIKESQSKFPKNCDITLTSVVDVMPTLNSNNLSVFQCADLDNYPDTHEPGINVVYCRNPIDKKSTKRYQKSIPENLLKHTFASQQKVRLKHE